MTRILSAVAVLLLGACSGTQGTAMDGAELYANYCSACHGVAGEGDGPVSVVMRTNVPNLRTLAQRSGGEFPRDAVRAFVDGRNLPVSHGDRQMPIWGNVFRWDDGSDAESMAQRRIAAVVDFLETLQYED
jgi:mono/diheme cytochrome c family protein